VNEQTCNFAISKEMSNVGFTLYTQTQTHQQSERVLVCAVNLRSVVSTVLLHVKPSHKRFLFFEVQTNNRLSILYFREWLLFEMQANDLVNEIYLANCIIVVVVVVDVVDVLVLCHERDMMKDEDVTDIEYYCSVRI
jgi:hypothetical protein